MLPLCPCPSGNDVNKAAASCRTPKISPPYPRSFRSNPQSLHVLKTNRPRYRRHGLPRRRGLRGTAGRGRLGRHRHRAGRGQGQPRPRRPFSPRRPPRSRGRRRPWSHGQEAVVHCAALASPWGRRAEFERANIGATQLLLDAAIAAGVRRFVHVSSPAIYAEFAHHERLTETSPLPPRPINDYARTKLAGERLVLAAADRIEVVVLRPHALLGVGDTVLLPRLVRAAARGRLPVIGDGRARTDLCSVENAALACRLALEGDAKRVAGEAFNVSNDEPVPLWDTLREFLRAAGLPGPHGRVPFPVAWAGAALAEGWSRAVSGREPAMTRYGAAVLAFSHTFDLTKARQTLGYAPRVSLAEGLARTARWWRERRAETGEVER